RISPIGSVGSLTGSIVDRQELADAIDSIIDHPVIAQELAFVHRGLSRKVVYQLFDPVLDKEETSRFQRFDEAPPKPPGNAVLYPRISVATDSHINVVSRAVF